MIRISRDSAGNILTYKSEGHTQYDDTDKEKTYLGVCAGLSTLEYTFLLTVKELENTHFDFKVKKGYFYFEITELKKDFDCSYKAVCNMFLNGLKILSEKHGRHISVTYQ